MRDFLVSVFVATTLGDLAGIDSSGIMGRLAVGADDTFLIADSGETLGLKWGTLIASVTAQGIVELATAAEVNTGTDATRAVTPDGLAGSNLGIRLYAITVFPPGTTCASGDGKAFFHITEELNGYNLVSARAAVFTAGTTNSMTIGVLNKTDGHEMLSTLLTVASGAIVDDGNKVIDPGEDDVITDDIIQIDVDTLHTTEAMGLIATLGFQLP